MSYYVIEYHDKKSNINAVNFIPEKNNVLISKHIEKGIAMDTTSRSAC